MSLDWIFLKQGLYCINSIMNTLVLNLYQKQNFQIDQLPVIPDEGNTLLQSLLDWRSDSPFQLNLLLNHPYFKLLKNEGIQLQIQCMTPKFKTHDYQVEDDELIL